MTPSAGHRPERPGTVSGTSTPAQETAVPDLNTLLDQHVTIDTSTSPSTASSSTATWPSCRTTGCIACPTPNPFSAHDRRVGYTYQLSILQLEVARTEVFDRLLFRYRNCDARSRT